MPGTCSTMPVWPRRRPGLPPMRKTRTRCRAPEARTLSMAAASYVPGGWLGLIRQGTAVILDPATPAPLVSTVWDLLAKDPDAAEVLHAVTGGFGAQLSASPCFGIIGFSDSLRVFLRG